MVTYRIVPLLNNSVSPGRAFAVGCHVIVTAAPAVTDDTIADALTTEPTATEAPSTSSVSHLLTVVMLRPVALVPWHPDILSKYHDLWMKVCAGCVTC